MDYININSGVTYINNNDYSKDFSIIFRKNESMQTVIHELIHNIGVDFNKQIPYHNILNKINIHPKTKLVLNEAYTEAVTNIINVSINSVNLKQFITNINYEINFCVFQIAKILLFFNFKDIQDFIKPYDNLNRFKQKTHVFSYYFVKTALLYNINDFYYFLDKNTNIFYVLNKNNRNCKTYI